MKSIYFESIELSHTHDDTQQQALSTAITLFTSLSRHSNRFRLSGSHSEAFCNLIFLIFIDLSIFLDFLSFFFFFSRSALLFLSTLWQFSCRTLVLAYFIIQITSFRLIKIFLSLFVVQRWQRCMRWKIFNRKLNFNFCSTLKQTHRLLIVNSLSSKQKWTAHPLGQLVIQFHDDVDSAIMTRKMVTQTHEIRL